MAKFSQKKTPNSSNGKKLAINKWTKVAFLIKSNKSSGYDDINLNVVKKCFEEINDPLKYIFNLILENGIFPKKRKLPK